MDARGERGRRAIVTSIMVFACVATKGEGKDDHETFDNHPIMQMGGPIQMIRKRINATQRRAAAASSAARMRDRMIQ